MHLLVNIATHHDQHHENLPTAGGDELHVFEARFLRVG